MIRVRVPATSANLGSGFDALGLGLNLYNEFIFEEIPKGLEIIGCEDKYSNEENLVYTSFLRTLEEIGYKFKGIRIRFITEIPESRGLGSSASCILAGVIGANILGGQPLCDEEVFQLATKIEGHPDNIGPALFGGLVTSISDGDNFYYNKIKVEAGLKFLALIPDFTVSTREARAVLPDKLDYKDGVYNVGRVSILISALANGRFDLLKYGVKDRIHEPYRKSLINDYDRIVEKSEALGSLGTYLSGAGPTIMVILREDDYTFKGKIEKYLASLEDNWTIKELMIENKGARGYRE